MSVERGRTAPEVRLLKLAFQAMPGIRVKPPTTELEAQRLEICLLKDLRWVRLEEI